MNASTPDPAEYAPLPKVSPVPGRPIPFDKIDLERFLDRALLRQLEESYVPGAAVAVVRTRLNAPGDPPMIVARGYGLADRNTGAKVHPMNTLFRLGSVSKLFTWTAVMQLAERGDVDLVADVNAYLGGSTIPATFPEPVTLANLLTHTAGFEANSYGYTAAAAGCDPGVLARTVRDHLPARVKPPLTDFTRGEGALYTNSAALIAGRIVAARSGLSFEEYVEKRIFDPLGMRRSSLRDPLPVTLAAGLAEGYEITASPVATCYRHPGFEHYCPVSPAAGGSATASDMARFMLAHLQEGRLGAERILERETVQRMHRRALSPHPHLNGGTYGFMERYINGRRTLWHQGTTRQFYTELFLLPASHAGVDSGVGVGLFVAYNSLPPEEFQGQLMQQFMDRYFPATLPDLVPQADAAASVSRHSGLYGPTVRSSTTWEKRIMLGRELRVASRPYGLELSSAHAEPTEWIALRDAPDVLRERSSARMIAFSEAADGRTYLLGDDPFSPQVKLRVIETADFDQAFRHLSIAGLVLVLLAAAVARLRRSATPYNTLQSLLAGAAVADLAILALMRSWPSLDVYQLMVELPWQVLAVMSLSIGSAVLTAAAVGVSALKARRWSLPGCLAHAALSIPVIAFVAWLWFWNLLGFQLA